jgi:CDP-diacylglycerol--glycerol-3-phosphate 3-phosphatidyltransferase
MLSRLCKDHVSLGLRPVAGFLSRLGVTPNVLTLLGLSFSLASGVFYGRGSMRLAGLLLLLSGLGDMMDGALARNTGTGSRFGAFIDSVADRYAEFFVFFGLLFWFYREQDRLHLVVALTALMGSVMVSYTRARAESIIGSCAVGLMERPERLVVLIAFSLLGKVMPALWILAVGANLTALRRIIHTWRMTRPRP